MKFTSHLLALACFISLPLSAWAAPSVSAEGDTSSAAPSVATISAPQTIASASEVLGSIN